MVAPSLVVHLSSFEGLAQSKELIAPSTAWLHRDPMPSGSIPQRLEAERPASPWPAKLVRNVFTLCFGLTYRKVPTAFMALEVHQVCQRTSPAARDREELVREERVAERLVDVWYFRTLLRPLVKC